MVKYYQNFQNVDQSFPGLKEDVKRKGGFLSVTWKNIPFSGTPVHQTLEQTVNRDVASRLTGTTAFNSFASARMRWTVTRSARSRITSYVKVIAGLSIKEDVPKELAK